MLRHQREAWKYDLPPATKLILLALADMAGNDSECWPSVSRLEQLSGLHNSTVREALHALEDAGLVAVVQQGQSGANGRPALPRIYRVLFGNPEEDLPHPDRSGARNSRVPSGARSGPRLGAPDFRAPLNDGPQIQAESEPGAPPPRAAQSEATIEATRREEEWDPNLVASSSLPLSQRLRRTPTRYYDPAGRLTTSLAAGVAKVHTASCPHHCVCRTRFARTETGLAEELQREPVEETP